MRDAQERSRAWGLVLGLALLTSLGACGGAPDGATDRTASTRDEEAAPGVEAEMDPSASSDPEQSAALEGQSEPEPGAGSLVVYSGRSQDLIAPILDRFEADTGTRVEVRWGDTAELAATLLEEGKASPADLFLAQDPGGLGAVSSLLAPLPSDLLERVDARFRDPEARWIGLSGRVRVIVYNTERVKPEDLPASLEGFTEPAWRGRVGWAPTNSSFQTMLTAKRALDGEDRTRAWVEGMVANGAVAYEKNTPVVAAVGAGEVDAGLVNHYYLYRFLAEEGESFPARNHFMPGGGAGSLVMVAGAGVLASAARPDLAEQLLAYLLEPEAQAYFATETFEYPLALGSAEVTPEGLPPLTELSAPNISLGELSDLPGTAAVLREAGALP